MAKRKLIATAAMGIEALVAKEVRDLGYTCEIENGRVYIDAEMEDIPRLNIWLRTADRVKLVVAEFKATTFTELFDGVVDLPWTELMPWDARFTVDGRSVKSQLFSIRDCQKITEKAIVDAMQRGYNKPDEWLPKTGAIYPIEVALLKDVATITIDTSGDALHRRGYRELHSQAPLKETMAAAMIKLTNWKPDMPFYDVFTGSGTLAIEAALIGRNIAPGLNREFCSQDWPCVPKKAWYEAINEANEKAEWDKPLKIYGIDLDPRMVKLAKDNADLADVRDAITFVHTDAAALKPTEDYGIIIGNPPYGERLQTEDEIIELYERIGQQYAKYPGYSVYMLTSYEDFEKAYGRPATKRRKLYNGNIETQYYQFFGKRPPRRAVEPTSEGK
ncbi:class I SAM-dependent RNA methyltransferase [Exiguobacterium sp. SH3S2]|uniref:THUMP domain-containing class I SAM-dependent RNA methyltransferase n=1 Tax=Exiguobacterium TaxID=33986 RepID=UPI0008777844|nr:MULTISPECIES: class I SAM-dependent RNA methyltransferase [Exiguobacterium]TCI42101.1 class I SAM-dependent RNA methyltransferase [Exiguobacterium sp. SH3S3]TCI58345.1 class I SAM-dependent RNA methyltransferase [Exiguobacterium sp. SH3S2]TCI65117.1 class I SAM-dependent RNA methyltransferase [Exiguobacterium sp. SH0S2]